MAYIIETEKKDIVEAIRIFGLKLDLDRWDNKNGQQFIRVCDFVGSNITPLIIYRENFQMKSLEDVIPHDINNVYTELAEYLKLLGESRFKTKIKILFN